MCFAPSHSAWYSFVRGASPYLSSLSLECPGRELACVKISVRLQSLTAVHGFAGAEGGEGPQAHHCVQAGPALPSTGPSFP